MGIGIIKNWTSTQSFSYYQISQSTVLPSSMSDFPYTSTRMHFFPIVPLRSKVTVEAFLGTIKVCVITWSTWFPWKRYINEVGKPFQFNEQPPFPSMHNYHHNFGSIVIADVCVMRYKKDITKDIKKNYIILRYLFLSMLLNDFPIKCQEDKFRRTLAFIFWVTQFSLHWDLLNTKR